MGMKEIGKEKSEIVDELLVLVIGCGVGSSQVWSLAKEL